MIKLIIFLLIAAPFMLNAQMTYVPDDNFEQALINLGYDTPPLNDSVPTKNIENVTYLRVFNKNIVDLTGIEGFKKLDSLLCYANRIIDLDLSKNPALTYLNCQFNELKNLNISKNPALKVLRCPWNKLSNLDTKQNSALVFLNCISNNLSSLNVYNNTSLSVIGVGNNLLTSLDVSNNHELIQLVCENNLLTNLDIRNGNNKNMFYDGGYGFNASYNPNLVCIQVDDSAFSATNSNWRKDSTAHYSTNCNYTGVDDFKFENKDVSIMPNPAQDFIELNNVIPAEAGILNQNVKIYNFLGEIVVGGISTPPDPLSRGGVIRIDISGLVPGMYFVRVGDSVQRFVKY